MKDTNTVATHFLNTLRWSSEAVPSLMVRREDCNDLISDSVELASLSLRTRNKNKRMCVGLLRKSKDKTYKRVTYRHPDQTPPGPKIYCHH